MTNDGFSLTSQTFHRASLMKIADLDSKDFVRHVSHMCAISYSLYDIGRLKFA